MKHLEHITAKHRAVSFPLKKFAPVIPILAQSRLFRFLLAAALVGLSVTSQAATLTWDATAGTAGLQDGSGVWRPIASNTNWWDGTANVVWNNATVDSVIFGAGSGAAGTVTISPDLVTNTVGNITFNAPGSGNYTIAGSDSVGNKLILVGTPTITVASGVAANLTVILGGTSYIKDGPGILTNNPGGNDNFNSGPTTVQGGTLVIGGSSSGRTAIPGDLIITNGSTAILANSEQIANICTLTVYTNSTFSMNGKSETVTSLILDGGSILQSSSEALTLSGSVDARSGIIRGGTGKLDVPSLTKSTSGTVTLGSRGSSAASGGVTTTAVNQGTLILDYVQNSSKLRDGGSLTINGGTLLLTNGTHSEAVASISLVSGIITNASGTARLSLPSPGAYDVQSGASYTVLAGTGGLNKSTPANVLLSAANTYSGDTRIASGSLTLGDVSGLGGTTLDMNVADSGSLSFGTLTSAIIGGLKGSRNLVLQNASSAPVAANVGNNNKTNTYTGVVSGSGSFNKIGNGAFFLDGTIAAAVTVSGGILGGNGTISAPVTVQSGGTLSPGDAAVGRFTINNSLTLQTGGDVVIELDKTAGTNDVIVGLSNVTYGGTLSISNLNSDLVAGDSFKIFSSANYTAGAFDSIDPLTPGANLVWDTSRLTVDGTLKVINEPVSRIQIDSITTSGSNIVIRGSGGTPGAGYSLLSSPDLSAPISSWTLVLNNSFDGSGNFSDTIPDTGDPHLFFTIRSP
jgi:autotransporter-associated beta strand protein